MPKASSGSTSFGGESQLSEYERQRLENISWMNNEIGDLYTNVTKAADDMMKALSSYAIRSPNDKKRKRESQNWQQNKTEHKVEKGTSHSQSTRRSIRYHSKTLDYNEQNNSHDDKSNKLRLKFPFFKKKEYETRDVEYYGELNDSDFIDSDKEQIEYNNDGYKTSPKRRRKANPHQIPVSSITTNMLKNISYFTSKKRYSSDGTTCHQCRQKTVDQKSYCRHKKCRGRRGMFCGYCLGKRYGEDVAEVLLNKKWACPPCRGYCNCSICRRKQGRSPTGQLSRIARAEGYKSVKHMLESTEGEEMEKNLSSDYDNDANDENDNSYNSRAKQISNHDKNVLSQEEVFDRIYRQTYPAEVIEEEKFEK